MPTPNPPYESPTKQSVNHFPPNQKLLHIHGKKFTNVVLTEGDARKLFTDDNKE